MRVLARSYLCMGGGNSNVKFFVRTFFWELSELHSREFKKGSNRFMKTLVCVAHIEVVKSRGINQNDTAAA